MPAGAGLEDLRGSHLHTHTEHDGGIVTPPQPPPWLQGLPGGGREGKKCFPAPLIMVLVLDRGRKVCQVLWNEGKAYKAEDTVRLLRVIKECDLF